MFKSSYETTSGQIVDADEIVRVLELLANNQQLVQYENLPIYYVVNGEAQYHNLPPFPRPIVFTLPSREEVIVFDAREITNKMGSVTSPMDFQLNIRRAAAALTWYQRGSVPFKVTHRIVMPLFAHWIKSSLTHLFNLPLDAQVHLDVVMAYYYICLCEDRSHKTKKDFDQGEILHIAKTISVTMKIPAENVLQVIHEGTYLESVDSLVNFIIDTDIHVNLQTLTPSHIFINCIRGSWWSSRSDEIVTSSIEFPPDFIAMVCVGIISTNNRKSRLGTLIYNGVSRGLDKQFVNKVDQLIGL